MAKHLIRVDRRDVAITALSDGLNIELLDGLCIEPPGAPALPGRLLDIALPEGQRPLRAHGLALATMVLQEAPVFVRAQGTVGIGDLAIDKPTAPRAHSVLPDAALYAAATRAPLAELRGTSWMGGVLVASVFVRPVRLTDAGDLELVTSLQIDLRTTADRKNLLRREMSRIARPRAIRAQDLAAKVVFNPEAVPMSLARANPTRDAVVASPGGTGDGGTAEPVLVAEPLAALPTLAAIPDGAGPREVDYLIVTDNHTWDAATVTPVADVPGMVVAFGALTAHKKARGLRCHVARITDIVAGVYGDHKTGTRDLQEILRRFLQAYVRSRGVEWVLLGGDVGIVPARQVCGSDAYGVFGAASAVGGPKVPKVGEYVWKDTFLALRLADDVATNPGQFGQPSHVLTLFSSGRLVPYRAGPDGNTVCWFYTDSTWTTASATPTPYARVNGPASIINDQPQWYTADNLIPTDLYYASLYADTYLQPGKHDWDLLGNGLYGQWSATTNLDGVDYTPDVSVGRVPAGSAAEVTRWVNKLIAYERAAERTAEVGRFRKALYVADHWGRWAEIPRHSGDPVTPDPWRYSHPAGTSYSVLRGPDLKDWPAGALLAMVSPTDRRSIPYDGTGTAARGWNYVVSATNRTLSRFTVNIPFAGTLEIPVPTETIEVRSNVAAELTPQHYVFDPDGLDSSIQDLEGVRKALALGRPRIDDIGRLYSDEDDLPAADASAAPLAHLTQPGLEAALNAGPHLVLLSGHGNWPGCCRFDVWLAQRLANGPRTFLVFADSCLTAQIDFEDSLGEVLLTGTDHGAVAYIGNSRFSWIGVGTHFQYDFFEQLSVQRHLGLILDIGRRLWTGGRYHRWAVYTHNLLGCPEMPVFRDDRDAEPLWIGNQASRELHERFCPWVRAMSTRNMRNFTSVQAALALGYDGCGFCLREHHTR